MNIGELFVFLGFKVDDKQLKDFDRGLQGIERQFDLTKIGAIAALYALDRFIESSVSGAVALYNFTQQTGLSAQALQQWQAAATAANPALTVEQVAQSIATLENNLLEIRKFGAGNASPFAWLQIDIAHGQTAVEVLEQLRDRVQGLDRITAVNLIRKMGLDPGFINILLKSREEFDALIKGMSRADPVINILEKLGERISHFKLRLVVLKDNFVAGFAAPLMHLIDLFEALGRAIDLVAEATQFDFSIFANTISIGIGLIVARLYPLTTAISALLLLLADLYVYKKGGQSVIGEVLQSDALAPLMEAFRKVQSGELKKIAPPEREIIDLRPGADASMINRNVTINNDIDINNPDKTFEAEKVVNSIKDQLDQIDLNWAYTDQQPKGSGY